VPIESPLMVCYLTSFKSNIVSVTMFEIFAAKIPDLDLGGFKVIEGQSSWCQSIAHGWFPIRRLLTQSSYLSHAFSQYLTCNFDDLQVCQFKVIQDKRGQSKAHWWFRIWPQLCLTLYLSSYLRYLMRVLWPRSRTVQGHPRSNVMVPIDSPWVISYSTSIDTIVVCVTIFKNIWRVSLMTLNQHSSRSSKVKDDGANR